MPDAEEVKYNNLFEVLESSIEAQVKLCAEIEQRLSSVLRNEPEATSAPVVGLASRINRASEQLHQLANNYNSILSRLLVARRRT
jgi:polyhydroxyalkanoate synthesis regulator phasin